MRPLNSYLSPSRFRRIPYNWHLANTPSVLRNVSSNSCNGLFSRACTMISTHQNDTYFYNKYSAVLFVFSNHSLQLRHSPSAVYSKTVVFLVLKWCIFMGVTISEVHGMLCKDAIMSVCSSIFKITQKISVNSGSVSLHQTLLRKFLFSLHTPTYMTLTCNSKKFLINSKTHTESHLK